MSRSGTQGKNDRKNGQMHTMKGRRDGRQFKSTSNTETLKKKNNERKLNNNEKITVGNIVQRNRPGKKGILNATNNKKFSLCNGQKKAATMSVDERCAFPLKLITITYRSLISVRSLRTWVPSVCAELGNEHDEMHRSAEAVHLLLSDIAKTFLCDRRGDHWIRPRKPILIFGDEVSSRTELVERLWPPKQCRVIFNSQIIY